MAFRASWIAMCIIAYIRDSWNGSSSGAMHAFMAASPACAFHTVTASPLAGAETIMRAASAAGARTVREGRAVRLGMMISPFESSATEFALWLGRRNHPCQRVRQISAAGTVGRCDRRASQPSPSADRPTGGYFFVSNSGLVGAVPAKRRILSTLVQKTGANRLSTHCCRFPNDTGWTAVDRG